MDNEMDTAIDQESVYDFYTNKLFPAIWASLPLLMNRLSRDCWSLIVTVASRVHRFLLPGWSSSSTGADAITLNMSNANYFLSLPSSSFHEFMLKHFDTNVDGHISPDELLNMTDILSKAQAIATQHQQSSSSFLQLKWISREWPFMDWKLSIKLWQSSSGLLLLLCLLSLIPGRLHSVLGKWLRWPVLGFTYFLIAVELAVYIVIRIFIRLVEATFANPKHRALRRKLRNATSYSEWYQYAKELDDSQGRTAWRHYWQSSSTTTDSDSRYNWAFVQALIADMEKAKKTNDSLLALAVLQQCTRKNVGGIMSEESFSYTNTGEPKIICETFLKQVVSTLEWVTEQCCLNDAAAQQQQERQEYHGIDEAAVKDYKETLHSKVRTEKKKLHRTLVSWATLHFDDNASKDPAGSPSNSIGSSPSQTPEKPRLPPQFHKQKVISFLKRARAAYGRTALCLSGGAMMGLYHFGHVKALLEMDLLPNIISGTSAGSVVGAIVCTRTPAEIKRDLDPAVLAQKVKCFHISWAQRFRNLYKTGCMFEYKYWRELIPWFTMGDMTFEEAFKKTGRVFCITLSATTKKAPPVLLNHISAPNVVIASAVIASAAVPGLIDPVRLEVKGPDGKISFQGDKDQTYWDGSIESDIPTSGLAEMLNCQFFIAAQCNPHIVPFFYNCRGGVGRPTRWSSSSMRRRHGSATRNTSSGDAWRGGFLLSALELYLKNDMKAKFQFLHDIEAALGFTGTMMIQQFVGSTTIVPQVSFVDYTQLMSDPSYDDILRYTQGGAIAAYEHCAMIRLHYQVADALDDCLRELESSASGGRLRSSVRRIGTIPGQDEEESDDADDGFESTEHYVDPSYLNS